MNAIRLFAVCLVLPWLFSSATAQTNPSANTVPALLPLGQSTNDASARETAGQDYEAGNYDAAYKEYRKVLLAQPYDDTALWNIAYCCFALSNFTDSVNYYQQYDRLNPGVGQTHFWMGCALVQLRQYHKAEKEFGKSIELDPHYVEAYDWLGWCLNQRRRYKEAGAVLKKAIDLNGESNDRLVRFATALIYSGDYAGATNVCGRLLELSPDDPASHCLMGDALYHARNYAAARSCFNAALRLKPDDERAQFALANIFFTTRKFSEAADAYKKASLLSPDSAQPHIWRGWSLFQARRQEDALAEMETAHHLAPHDVSTQMTLFTFYLATAHYRTALAAYPLASIVVFGWILGVALGGFAALTVLSLSAGPRGPGILVSLAWTAVFFAQIYAAMLLAGLIPGVQPHGALAFGLLAAHIPFLLTALLFFSARPWGAPYLAKLNLPSRIWVRALIAYALVDIFISAYQFILRPPESRSVAFLVDVIRPYPVSIFLAVVILSPLAEEILCRGLIFAALRQRIGLWAIPLTSLLFAAYHFDPAQFICLFAFGLVLAWAREVSGTIWLPFLIHAANNALAYFLMRALAPA